MKRFVEGQDRNQSTLFPERLDEYIAEDNPVRVIDAFVDELDLGDLGFERVVPQVTGRPGYHPATLLKIYVYGYLNRIQSSRRLERETQRNVELMWLTEQLMPDFKTIAELRKDNGKAIRQVCRQFIELCRSLDLFTQAIVAIDGSKFKAVNSKDRNGTRASMKRRIARMKRLKKREREVVAHPDKQLSQTDPDSRLMKKGGMGSQISYNVQTAVDTEHKLIIAHDVTNAPVDRNQLFPVAALAQYTLGQKELKVLADRGYYKGEAIKACYDAGIKVLVPKTQTSGNKAAGLFDKSDFHYDESADHYQCPAGEMMQRRFNTVEKGKIMQVYFTPISVCRACKLRSKCTTSEQRRIRRWEHEGLLDAMEENLNNTPDAMPMRSRMVEHPYGTLKAWMGHSHFLTRRLKNVRTEMSLHVLAYNLRRMISIMGVVPLMEAIRA